MGSPYSQDLRVRVLAALDDGMSKMAAHKIFGISRSTLDDWLRRREQTGSVQANTSYRRGRRPALPDTPDVRLCAKASALHTATDGTGLGEGIFISATLELHDLLHHAPASGVHTQKKSCLYQERCAVERDAFVQQIAAIAPADRVYVDEAGVEDTLNYAYGWSLKGTRCWGEKLGHRTQRVSMAAAWCQGQVLAPLTFEGYCDSALIETWFARHLLPVLPPGQVVVLDNASFHRKHRLREIVESIGCRLLPLPAYSPDLNRIEPLWNMLKAHIRHNTSATLSFRLKVDAAFCSL